MLDKIIPSNARTQTIEYAVNELSKRENLTMNDVREYLDIFTQTKIDTGKKKQVHVTDPDTGEVLETREYPVMEPIAKFYSYRADEKEIYSEALANILANKKFYHELKDDAKVSDILLWAKQNANFIEKEDIISFTYWLFDMILEIRKTCKTGSVDKTKQNAMHLEFNSTTKGSGKSHFIEEIIKQAQMAGIEAKSECKLPEGGFDNTLNETYNLLVGYKERVYQKVDEATMMSIGRHEPYVYTEKMKMSINVPSNAITIGSTNGNPYAKDDRCFRIIRCLPVDYETRMNILQTSTNFLQTFTNDLIRYNTTIYNVPDEKVCNFVSFLKKIYKENNNNIYKQNCNKLQNYKQIPGMSALVDAVNDLTGEYELLDFVSVKGLYKLWEKQTGKHLEGTNKYMSFEKPIAEALNFLYSRKLVSGRGPSDDMKRQYNLFSILDDIRNYDYSEKETTIEGDVIDAMKEWDRLIQLALDFENGNPEPPKEKFLKPTEDKLPDLDGWSFGEKYDAEFTEVNLGQQQVCVNKTKGKTANRTNEGVEGCNYLCECDDISKGEQMDYIEKLPQGVKDSIIWVCDSGGKSIHVVLKTASNCNGKEREYILKKLSDKYFGGHLDMSAKNASRLCRNPNAMRDNGMKQQCLYMNLNPKPLDVSEWKFEIDKKMEEKEEERKLMNSIRFINSSNSSKEYSCNTLDKLKDWYSRKPTDMKADCIAFLEGRLKDWNKGIACVRALRNYGFTDTDIELEGPVNDTWIKQSIKGAR